MKLMRESGELGTWESAACLYYDMISEAEEEVLIVDKNLRNPVFRNKYFMDLIVEKLRKGVHITVLTEKNITGDESSELGDYHILNLSGIRDPDIYNNLSIYHYGKGGPDFSFIAVDKKNSKVIIPYL